MKWMRWITGLFGSSSKSATPLGVGLRTLLNGSVPGGWASDHREETAHNTGFNYIAIHAIASQVASATVTVFADGEQQPQRRSQRKSLAASAGSFHRWKSIYGLEDRETDPLPVSHPLVKLMKRPNPYECGSSFRYRQAQQIRLTGTCLVWNVPSFSGPTCERYVIPTAMASAVAPSRELPRGGWRISPVASRYTTKDDHGYFDCPHWYRILGQILDARQVQVIRLPHAWFLDDGQSPLSAGAKWIDAGEAVDEARYHQLRNGVDPSIVWSLPPDVMVDQDEIDRTQARISAKYGGAQNVGRVMVAQSGTTITPLGTSPKEMCYGEGFQDFKSAILALHQTPPVAVGLQEAGAYAAYNASMKAWRHSAIQPLCDLLAESDTEELASQFGSGLTVEIESNTVDDTELIEEQLKTDLAARTRTKNEWRAVRGMPPLPSPIGDVLVGTDFDPTDCSSPQSEPQKSSGKSSDGP
ncbi:phage portal protein [Schlesneria sp. T3-172]|uniref:phage portal protein n=1 Tax=Schlesneria sphaerica TaxID=3373610 RepID=UPI0037C51D26